jgi:hypothetical protein
MAKNNSNVTFNNQMSPRFFERSSPSSFSKSNGQKIHDMTLGKSRDSGVNDVTSAAREAETAILKP